MTSRAAAPRMTRPTFWQYGWQVVGFGVLYVAVAYCAVFLGFGQFSWRLPVALVAALIVLVALAIGYGVSARRGARRLERLATVAAGAFVFQFSSALGFGNIFPDPETRKPLQSTTTEGFGASVDGAAITVWFGETPRQVARLEWASVVGIHRGKVSTGGLNYPSASVSYLSGDGSTRVLEFVKASAEPLAVRSKVEVDWVVEELNERRPA